MNTRMTNVYIDPFSSAYLSDALFEKNTSQDKDDRLLVWRYLKDYCFKKNILLHTIDFWSEAKATDTDIYVSIDHKNFLRKLYWKLRKNRKYPIVRLRNFKKKILFHAEPPTVTPEVYLNIHGLFHMYDQIYVTCKTDDPRCRYFQIPRPYKDVLSHYWENSHRKFLVMIQVNKHTRLSRRLIMWMNKKRLYFQKDLLGERIKIIKFFSRTNEIDLYGIDWDKRLPFPYWFSGAAIQKVYKGPVDSKFQTLSEYTFAIAMENNITPGFIGEVLFDCFYVGTIPVYLGAPDIEDYIPKNCFIDMRDFADYKELQTFLKSLNASHIASYREHARQFLKSEQYKPFTTEYFGKIFVDACL